MSTQFNQISSKTLTVSSRLNKPIATTRPASAKFPIGRSDKQRNSASLVVQAVSDDEWGNDGGSSTGTAVIPPPVSPSPSEILITELKKKLVDSFDGTDRGLKAKSETRAQIVELITQLEALNPTPAPTEALPLLNGKWILA